MSPQSKHPGQSPRSSPKAETDSTPQPQHCRSRFTTKKSIAAYNPSEERTRRSEGNAFMMSKPCWECLKRRLVCDLGRPGCQKCQSRDTECPGYDKKPLKWLHPGQTRSKGRRAKNESNVIQLALKDTTEATTLFEAIEYCTYSPSDAPDSPAHVPTHQTMSTFAPIW